MSYPAPKPIICLRSILSSAGFKEDWSYQYTDQQPTYVYRFDDLVLRATQVTSRFLRPIFLFSGICRQPRTLIDVQFEMPTHLETHDQGIAWIADALKRHGYWPIDPPAWCEKGLAAKGELPWVRSTRLYEARPQCSVESDWLRVVARKLKARAAVSRHDAELELAFDGAVLRIVAESEFWVMPAKGKGWDEVIKVHESGLLWALARLPKGPLHLAIWEARLHLGQKVITLLTAESSVDLSAPENPAQLDLVPTFPRAST